MSEPKLIARDEAPLTPKINPVASFYAHGIPGMTLRAKEPESAPKPILNRCDCGKVISANKSLCRACLDQAIERIASGSGTQADIQCVMRQSTPEERVAIVHRLRQKMAEQNSPKEQVSHE